MRKGITVEFGISRSRLRQIWYKCPLQKKIEGSQQQSMAEAPTKHSTDADIAASLWSLVQSNMTVAESLSWGKREGRFLPDAICMKPLTLPIQLQYCI